MSEPNDSTIINGANGTPYEPEHMEGHAITVRIRHPQYINSSDNPAPIVRVGGIIHSVDTEKGVYNVVLDNELGTVSVEIREADQYMEQKASGLDGAMDNPAPQIGS